MREDAIRWMVDQFEGTTAVKTGGDIGLNCLFAPELHDNGEDRKPSMYIDINDNGPSSWVCFTCHKKGLSVKHLINGLKFYREVPEEVKEFVDEYEVNRDDLDVIESDLEDIDKDFQDNQADDGIPEWDDSELRQFKRAVPKQFIDRGFEMSTMKKWEIRLDDQMRRGVIPVRKMNGELAGIQGRALLEAQDAKYYNYWHFPAKELLFGEHLVDPEKEMMIIVEGPLDAIWLDQCEFDNPVALFGAGISEQQVERVEYFGLDVVVMMDGDEAGRHAQIEVVEKLRDSVKVFDAQIPQGFDPEDIKKKRLGKIIDEAEFIL